MLPGGPEIGGLDVRPLDIGDDVGVDGLSPVETGGVRVGGLGKPFDCDTPGGDVTAAPGGLSVGDIAIDIPYPGGPVVGRGKTGGRTGGNNGWPFGSCVDPGTGNTGGGNTGIRGLCCTACRAARCC